MNIPKGYDPELYRMRHSAAHVMAQAVRERFGTEGEVHFAGGPPVENGFYYDFGLPRPVEPADLEWIEARMKEILRADHSFSEAEVTADQARTIFHDQPFKLELIEGLAGGQLDEDGNPREGGAAAVRITTYQHDSFRDLCQGPHVERTGQIPADAVKLLNAAGAYWRGDERRPMLQRIYGTAWRNKEELDKYLWAREEAEKRDHRRLGKELDLFHFHPYSPGAAFWTPKGTAIYTTLSNYMRHLALGNEEQRVRSWQEQADESGCAELAPRDSQGRDTAPPGDPSSHERARDDEAPPHREERGDRLARQFDSEVGRSPQDVDRAQRDPDLAVMAQTPEHSSGVAWEPQPGCAPP